MRLLAVALSALLLAPLPAAAQVPAPDGTASRAGGLPESCYGFISADCCCTSKCCWPISAEEVEPLADGRWLVKATGEKREQTDWSPDGKYYRCACDRREAGKWIPEENARTRCLFSPMKMF